MEPNDWVSLQFTVGAFSKGYVNSTTRPETFIRDVKYQGTDKNCEEEIVLTGAKQKLAQKLANIWKIEPPSYKLYIVLLDGTQTDQDDGSER